MEEVPSAGEVHRRPSRLRDRENLFIAHGTTWRHDVPDSRPKQDLQPVGEREERVRRGDCPAHTILTRSGNGQACAIDAIHLPHPDSNRGSVTGDEDCVALDPAAGAPCKLKIGELIGTRRITTCQRPRRHIVAGSIDAVRRLHEQATGHPTRLDTRTRLNRCRYEWITTSTKSGLSKAGAVRSKVASSKRQVGDQVSHSRRAIARRLRRRPSRPRSEWK